jgi:uncharacterized repeat protein (TIGR01451 family)
VAATGSSYLATIAKTGPSLVSVGDQFAYEITVTAKSDVADTTITDNLPAGATFVSGVPVPTQAGNKLTWKIGNMNAGESKVVRVVVKAEKEGELVECATVYAIPRICVSTMVGRPHLSIKKTGLEFAQLGQEIAYVVVVQNTGNVAAKDVVVTDTVPEGLSSATGQKEITFNIGELAAGASKSVSVPLKANKRGKSCNTAVVTASNADKAEAEACTTVVQSGIKIEKSTKDTSIFMNRTADYDIVVSNTGDTDLSGVMVTDVAAAETIIAAAPGATVSGTTATWNVGTLKAGDKKNLAVKVLSKVPGRFCDTASVTSAQGLKDSAQSCTEWRGVTGVLLEMVDDPDPIQVGEVTHFTIRVQNQGTSIDIKGLTIVATVPPELELVPGTVSDGGKIDGRTISWPTVPSVGPKAVVTRTYVVKGVKVGDARSKVSITTTMRKDPIDKEESTTVY